jgi:ribonucleotide monophosphatase NagD (HAD superfamily)
MIYERLGGRVVWTGKPHPEAYANALAEARRRRGDPFDNRRVLAIGDAVRTDIAAAAGAGLDALFIAAGLHRDEVLEGGQIAPDRLATLFTGSGPRPTAAAARLGW